MMKSAHSPRKFFGEQLHPIKKLESFQNPRKEKFYLLNKGRAAGRILGGNLTLLNSLLGTEYLPKLKGAILLLEDIHEAPYRIDRMLNQLRLAKVLNRSAVLCLVILLTALNKIPQNNRSH